MGRRAVRPLNQQAAQAADASITPDAGDPPPICARDHPRFHERWLDAYVAHGGQVEVFSDAIDGGRRDPPGGTIPATVTPCPCMDAVILSETVVDTDPAHLPKGAYAATEHDIVLPRERRHVAVGEEVMLTYSRGPAEWHVLTDAGTAQIFGSPGTPTAGNSTAYGSTIAFFAGPNSGTVTIQAEGDGCHRSITFEVVEPQTLACYPDSGLIHTEGYANVGAYMTKRIGPNEVCFINVGWLELDAFAVATGMWTPNHGQSHNPSGTVIHGTSRVKAIGGTLTSSSDKCYSGTMYSDQDYANGVSGGFYIDIPHRYGVITLESTVSRVARFSPVRMSVDTNNVLGVNSVSHLQKGGYTVSCAALDPSSNASGGEPLPREDCTDWPT